MKSLKCKLIFLVFVALLTVGLTEAQQDKAGDAAKKKAQVEKSYKKAYAKARQKTIKHRREIQTDATREMMDAADKRAKSYNRKDAPSFLERLFKRKKPGKR